MATYKFATSSEVAAWTEKGDLAALAQEGPLVFEKTERINNLICCSSWAVAPLVVCITPFINPLNCFCPGKMFPHYSVQLNADSITYNDAANDCCCHIAKTQKTIPLDRIQDVELVTDCCLTCFDLKRVVVQTAGTGGPTGEMNAAFLAHPEQVRDALKAAVQTVRAGGAPAQAAMSRGGGPLRNRLSNLDSLVKRGIITSAEADAMRVGLLTAPSDLAALLLEVSDLLASRLISEQEHARLKADVMAQCKR